MEERDNKQASEAEEMILCSLRASVPNAVIRELASAEVSNLLVFFELLASWEART
jgi:hypothetical protein